MVRRYHDKQRNYSCLLNEEKQKFFRILSIIADQRLNESYLIVESYQVEKVRPGIFKYANFCQISREKLLDTVLECEFVSIVDRFILLTPFKELN